MATADRPRPTTPFVHALTGPGASALARTLGLERFPPAGAAPDVLDDLGGRPETVARLRARLSPPAFRLLLRWVIEGEAASWWARSLHDGLDDPAWLDDVARLRDEVVASGVAAVRGDDVLVLPALAAALHDEAERFALGPPPSGADEESTAPPVEFALALVVCAFDVERPLVTKAGDVHATAAKRLIKRLGGSTVLGFGFAMLETLVRRLGLVTAEPDAEKAVALASPATVAEYFGRPAPERALLLLGAAGGPDRTLRVLAALRALAATEGSAGSSIERVLDASRRAVEGAWHGRDPLDGWTCAHLLRSIVGTGLAARVPGTNRFVPRAPAEAQGAFVVQPSLEVLVPWDAPAGDVVRLGLVADLEHVDRVCRFRLSRDAALRGRRTLGGADAVLGAVRGARGTVPSNVEATVRGWLDGPRAAAPFRGDVLVLHDASQRRALEAAVATGAIGPVEEIAPGVFLLLSRDAVDAVHALRRAGVHVDPIRQAVGHTDRRARRDLGHEVATLVATLNRYSSTIDRERSIRGGAAGEPSRGGPRETVRAAGGAAALLRDLSRELGVPESFLRDVVGLDETDDPESVARRLAKQVEAIETSLGVRRRPARGRTAPAEREPPRTADCGAATPAKRLGARASPPWTTMLPGALAEHFKRCAAEARAVEIVYVNGQGRRVEHTIVPVSIGRAGRNEVVEANDAFSGGRATYRLDQVMAVRDA